MPLYDFQHPETGEYIELSFGMNDEKKYVDESGVEWIRVFEIPNARPPNRSFDPDKPIYDSKGREMRKVPITDKFLREQGFSNAADYIEWNNSMVDNSKTPERNLERAHQNEGSNDVKDMIRENNEMLKKNNQKADQKRKKSKDKLSVTAHTDSNWKGNDQFKSEKEAIKAYDKHASEKTYKKLTVEKKKK
jgi:ElaB/YqjD/DUF883 family membrane-anchored ribosome-binding protein